MQFENTYHGVRKLLRVERLAWVLIAVTVFFPLGIPTSSGSGPPDRTNTWIILFCGAAVTIYRVLALGKASLEEEAFASAQKMLLIAFGIFLLNYTFFSLLVGWISPLRESKGIIHREYMDFAAVYTPIVMQTAALYFFLSSTRFVIQGVASIALKVKDIATYDQAYPLTRLLTGLLCASVLTEMLKAVLPKEISSARLFRIPLGFALLAYVIFVCARCFCFLKQAQKMLLYAEYEPENIWTGIARELLPDAFDYGTPSESVAFRSCTRFDLEDSVSSSDQ